MRAKTVMAFDIYGTIVDTAGVYQALHALAPENAAGITEMWRNKQLEYSFRQTAMGMYRGFAFCTRTALDYTCRHYQLDLSAAQKADLLDLYNRLPAFADAKPTLKQLNKQQLFAFSNGESENLTKLLTHNGLIDCFNAIISVEKTRHFKPTPKVYEWFAQTSNSDKDNIFLVSSNPFDVIGAADFGFKTIWVQRSKGNLFDDWGIKPNFIIDNLTAILDLDI